MIICTSTGVYREALTRGKAYELLGHDARKAQVKVRGDNGRTRWYATGCFDLTGKSVPNLLVGWRFDDPVQDEINERDETNNWVDVVMEFSDGTKRWCGLTTPEYLKRLLEPRDDPSKWGGEYEPAVWSECMIVMRDLAVRTVEWTLKYLDSQDELVRHSQIIGGDKDEETDLAL